MKEKSILIRPATKNDAITIAQVVVMAIGDEQTLKNYCGKNYVAVLEEIARLEKTQYSFQNSLIAEVEGKIAGAIVGYAGARLLELRNGTFAIIEKHLGTSPNMEPETSEGEFYLDSIAVFREFRGCGIGRNLIFALCKKALAEGHEKLGLLVDFDNPAAENLYTSIGFVRKNQTNFLGHKMWHMQKKL
ncbi:MAG: GNAT family N-acetyltransferase [Paludibacteraceae bacterium]|nr:GNAT family N-acetyltransferase [Paludibacteraceae bacterium]